MDSFECLKNDIAGCERCQLCQRRHHIVIGTGNEQSPIMFIGEGPGEQEDLQGEPFVGPAGKLLDLQLELIGLDRSSVYICNIVKCRPPQNRDPAPEERTACREWLDRQIALVNPKVIVCLGRIAATALIDPDFKISKEHGKWFYKDGRRFLATYHPSALLRNENIRPAAFVDYTMIRQAMEEGL